MFILAIIGIIALTAYGALVGWAWGYSRSEIRHAAEIGRLELYYRTKDAAFATLKGHTVMMSTPAALYIRTLLDMARASFNTEESAKGAGVLPPNKFPPIPKELISGRVLQAGHSFDTEGVERSFSFQFIHDKIYPHRDGIYVVQFSTDTVHCRWIKDLPKVDEKEAK